MHGTTIKLIPKRRCLFVSGRCETLLLPICIHTTEAEDFFSECCCKTVHCHSPKDRRNTDDVLCRSENRRVKSSLPPGRWQQQVLSAASEHMVLYVANKSGEVPTQRGLLHNRQPRGD